MNALISFLALSLLSGFCLADVYRMKPSEAPGGGTVVGMVIHGQIDAADVSEVQSYVEAADLLVSEEAGALKMLVLNSEGGDLGAAMQIGRIIRAHDYLAQIQPKARCLSACVYILAAAKRKQVLGSVGVHRPYFGSYGGKNAGRDIAKTLQGSKQFFREVNIPDGLAEIMFSTPPEEIKILSAEELRSYRLDQDDIEYAENNDIESAKSLGVSRADYMRFKRELDYKCKIYMGDQQGMMECLDKAKSEFLSSVQREGR